MHSFKQNEILALVYFLKLKISENEICQPEKATFQLSSCSKSHSMALTPALK